MKVYLVSHRHEVVGVFRDIAKAGEYAEQVVAKATPDPEGIWGKDASIAVKEIETDML